MSNKTKNDFINLGDMIMQEMDSQDNLPSNIGREVYPEFSDPNDYSRYLPLNNSTNYNKKQGMKFINKQKSTTSEQLRFQPYNRATTSSGNSGKLTLNPGEANKENINVETKQKLQFSMAINRPSSSRSKFVMENGKGDSTGKSNQRSNLPGSKFRHLIGSVDQVLRWHKSVKNSDLSVMYEVNGILECKRSQGMKHLLFIRGESGQILQALYYEIDRPIPETHLKSPIIVTGRMIGFRKMQIYDIQPLNAEDYASIQRVSFLCQRALNEALEH